MMIEKIPLSLIIHDTVMIGPATVLMLRHNDSLILVWSHRILAHCISKDLGILPYIRIGKIIIAIVFKCERALGLTVRKILQAVHTDHLHFARSPFHDFTRIIVSKFLHIVLQLCATAVAPENIGVAVRSKKYARVNTMNTLDRLRFAHERAFRAVCNCHTDSESPCLGCIRKIEVVFSVLLDTIRSPHRICIRLAPRDFFLSHDNSMISPGGKIFR